MKRFADFIVCVTIVAAVAVVFEVTFFEITIGPERTNMATILWTCVTNIG